VSSRPSDVIWPAEPHTIAKIQLVEGYAYVWASILGITYSSLTIIDGFAGPGAYSNYSDGSPIVALKSIDAARRKAGIRWQATKILALFIEEDKERCEHLRKQIQKLDLSDEIDVPDPMCSSFVEGIDAIEKRYPKVFASSAPLFAFVDPFGIKGIPFGKIAKLLQSRTSEVLINFCIKGITRNIRNTYDHLFNDLFGDESWRDRIHSDMEPRQLVKESVRLYIDRLRNIPNVDYVFAFEMSASNSDLDYFLVFASQNAKGLRKMKEQMKKIDQTGSFQFRDAYSGQQVLFRYDHPEDWQPIICDKLRGQSLTWSQLDKFILNETPFWDFKKDILKPLEKAGKIEVVCEGERRAFSYPEDRIRYITFVDN